MECEFRTGEGKTESEIPSPAVPSDEQSGAFGAKDANVLKIPKASDRAEDVGDDCSRGRCSGDHIIVESGNMSTIEAEKLEDGVNPFSCNSPMHVEIGLSDTKEMTVMECCSDISPGAEELSVAMNRMMMLKEVKIPHKRQLQFESCSDVVDSVRGSRAPGEAADEEEKMFSELVYQYFLDVVVAKQAGEYTEECFPNEGNSSQCHKTPTDLPLLNGVADTCPGAPIRHCPSKHRKLDIGTCRKLKFSRNLD